MATADHKQRLQAAYADIGQGNPTTFLDLLAADVRYTVIGTTAFSRALRSRDALVRDLFAPMAGSLVTPIIFEVDTMIAEGDRVAVQARGRATLRSGVPYNNTYCFVFRFAGERVAEVIEYLDTALVERAFAVPVDRQDLLHHMDLNMWEMFRDTIRVARGGELVETPQFYMGYIPTGTPFHNMVMVRSAVDEATLFAAIRDHYVRRGRMFSIWTRAHADARLEATLRQRGFTAFTAMPGMALLADPGTRCEPPGLDIRPATTDEGRRHFQYVNAEAYATYGAPREYAADAFVALESVCAPHLQAFIGYLEGQPVASAAVYVTHGVAGIGWVGTVPEQRRHGYAEAVTWAAIREGLRRGGRFANLQASVMGRPIYERMGFITATEYRVMVGTV